jgi:hypothetical protein
LRVSLELVPLYVPLEGWAAPTKLNKHAAKIIGYFFERQDLDDARQNIVVTEYRRGLGLFQ